MTWEWAFLLSVVIVCLTISFCCIVKAFDLKNQLAPEAFMEEVSDDISQLKADHEAVVKTSEETKKLLSQANLAMGFIPRAKK